MAGLLSVPAEELGSSHSAFELPQLRRIASDESRKSYSSSSPSPRDRDSKSFWDINMIGEESVISLTSADEEKWMISQVSNRTNNTG